MTSDVLTLNPRSGWNYSSLWDRARKPWLPTAEEPVLRDTAYLDGDSRNAPQFSVLRLGLLAGTTGPGIEGSEDRSSLVIQELVDMPTTNYESTY